MKGENKRSIYKSIKNRNYFSIKIIKFKFIFNYFINNLKGGGN
jgi:hypothetical protein